MWIVDRIYRLSDLIASVVCFDRFFRCLLFRSVVLIRLYLLSPLHKNQCIYQWLLIEDVVLCLCWSYLLICIVVDNDVNIAAKQCFSCTNALCYISTTSLYHKLSINIQLEGVDSAGAAWQSYSIRMDWNGMMIRVLVWWEEQGLWAEGLQFVSGSYSDVNGCSNQIIYVT